MASNKEQNINFEIKDEQLVVSIGIESLKRSIEHDAPEIIVTDSDQAAVAIKRVISSEEQDGRTPFHSMIAEAAYRALEDGELGLDEINC
ncbi:hypothetical protein [Pseudoalteromonas ruthenica]|uniref:hypothetical protein n=1 Tax=Pseudoalteromonas ruthenica TaxID=151081 RepID=UPI00110B945B|nr:hypothetical protein [Pseudoalteromonas ruthenica]TMO87681.1 hypothetical protein CWC12_10405 [Pseudoalteromonas ruthenica]TMP20852.1 hypothetical protein CWC06_19525 [Pseudoalteromonas ruthenica]